MLGQLQELGFVNGRLFWVYEAADSVASVVEAEGDPVILNVCWPGSQFSKEKIGKCFSLNVSESNKM